MAQNDMYAVMYRIIAYLYSCMKKGEEPDISEWDARAMGIPAQYWAGIVGELVEHGYIAGVEVWRSGRETKVAPSLPRVTMEGVAFAEENSMMAKARKLLLDMRVLLPTP